MESSFGFAIGFMLLVLALGIRAMQDKRQIDKMKRRIRALSERLEAVEKFNGLNQTSTDFSVRRS